MPCVNIAAWISSELICVSWSNSNQGKYFNNVCLILQNCIKEATYWPLMLYGGQTQEHTSVRPSMNEEELTEKCNLL